VFIEHRQELFVMNRIFLPGFVAFFCCGMYTGSVIAADSMEYLPAARPDFSLGLGFDYETGDYGSDSDFISVPLYLDIYPTERFDLELIVPYVYQRLEDDGVTTVWYRTQGGYVGSEVRTQGNGQNGATANGNGNNGNNSDSLTDTSETVTTGRHTSESGLGDISLTAGYVLVEESQTTPQVRPTLYLKFPTADEDKGLGSGEFDFGPGLTLYKWLDDWHFFAEGLYVFQGDSGLYETKDYFSYNAGVGHQFSENLYGAVQVRGATAPAEGAEQSLEGRFKVVWRMASDISLEGYVGTGLSGASADFSSSLAVFFDF
jgi:Putative MetA-pathway of phenol degradation